MTTLGHFDMKEVPIPKPGPFDILVKMKHVGICGSDVHYYEHGKIGDFIVTGPIILGHECAGEIVELGASITEKWGFKVGDQVCLEPGYGCGKCDLCRTGKYNLCEDMIFMATPPYDGALQEYVCYPLECVFKLPKNMSTRDGALMEPLSVGMHACQVAEASIGKSAVILGAGPIGLVTLLSLKARGVSHIYVTDLVQQRLDTALRLGATEGIIAKSDVLAEVNRLTNGKGVDMVFETAGSTITTQLTVDLVKKGGMIVLVGMPPDGRCNFNMSRLIGKEAQVRTVFRYRHCYPLALNAIEAGLIKLDELRSLITHSFKFDTQCTEAFVTSRDDKVNVIKAMIEM